MLLLAVPGVIVSAVLTAMFSIYVFNYNWSWNTGMTFGAILAATDPVAVVSDQLTCLSRKKFDI